MKSIEDRFWAKVDKTSSCWNWIHRKQNKGYGAFSVNGVDTLAHRYAYFLSYGEIAKGMYILHKCNNPACCNPEHLYMGTQKQNMQDKLERYQRGELKYKGKSGRVLKYKFTPAEADEMRRLYNLGIRTIEIGELMGTSSFQVRKLLAERTS